MRAIRTGGGTDRFLESQERENFQRNGAVDSVFRERGLNGKVWRL